MNFSDFVAIMQTMEFERVVKLKRLNLILAALAVAIFAAVPNTALADSVSVSASASTEFKMEINSNREAINYSGVIVDCRGLGLRSAASPVIKSENGKIIYGDKDLDFDKINEIGMAAYATTMQESVARVGENPFIVRAVKLDNFNSCPVLSNKDAARVLVADETSGFFKDLRVVFLTD